MSTLKAEIVEILNVEKAPKSDRLDVVTIKGWNVITGRDAPYTHSKYKIGDLALYIPIDSILPPKLEEFLFPPDSKITLHHSRVMSIKIRGVVSQGMVVGLNELNSIYPGINKLKLGTDVTSLLEITKYEPPKTSYPIGMKGTQRKKNNPLFHKYTDIENYKNYPDIFTEGEEVWITEKIHGTNGRFGILPTSKDRWWKHILSFFKLLPKYEIVFGSRNLQLQNTMFKKVWYSFDVYGRVAKELNIESILKPGEILYGEIFGYGIQGGYYYGHKEDQISFRAFDIMRDDKYLDPVEFFSICDARGINTVPLLYHGPFNKEAAITLTKGDSTIGDQKVREGIVVKPAKDINTYCGRKCLKMINDDYLLLKYNTDFH